MVSPDFGFSGPWAELQALIGIGVYGDGGIQAGRRMRATSLPPILGDLGDLLEVAESEDLGSAWLPDSWLHRGGVARVSWWSCTASLRPCIETYAWVLSAVRMAHFVHGYVRKTE